MEKEARGPMGSNPHERAHALELMARGDWPDAFRWLEEDLQDLHAAVDSMADATEEERAELQKLADARFADAYRALRCLKGWFLTGRKSQAVRTINARSENLVSLDGSEAEEPHEPSSEPVAKPDNVIDLAALLARELKNRGGV